ncbi:MAG: tetratricopeptide repeat protein [Rhodoferax sp.]|nr:tetratricopeptide repeat protein [Rhodoferax sp.]
MHRWTPFPHPGEFPFDAASVRKQWSKLHLGDQETLPKDPKVLAAWVHFHRGQFEEAFEAGLKAGPNGITVANKAACIYANYLEPKEKLKHEIFNEVAQRAARQIAENPDHANAHYWQGYALGRFSQGISVARALALGLGGKIKTAFETTIRLEPQHGDAYIALGTFHAEVIDKVGAMIGNMTYGAKKEVSLHLFQQGLALKPKSPIAMMEYANALVILEGESRHEEATALYERAAATKPMDAMERLDVDMAQAELASN